MSFRSALQNTTTSDPLERALRDEARAINDDLAKDPRYKRLQIITKALDDLADLKAKHPLRATLFDNARELNDKRQAGSILQGAEFALEDAGYPLLLNDLLAAMEPYGKMPGGAKPTWNLSNALSGDDRFRSVDWKGEKHWWLTGREVPPE